jgi:Flp pilus assembly protein TadD
MRIHLRRNYNSRGAMARDSEMSAAVEAYQRVVAVAPDHPDSHLALARALRGQHRFREAAESFRRVIELRPSDLQAQLGLGSVLHKAGELKAAIGAYVRVLQMKPDCVEALTNLGLVCGDSGDSALAADLQRQAIAFAPGMAEAHNNLGSVLSKQGNIEDALICFGRALALKPDLADARFNIGYTFVLRGDLGTAERWFRDALELKPQSHTMRFFLGVLHLLQGRFSPGWQEYEFRWSSRPMRNQKRTFSQPQWRGETLRGDSILLYAEQGLGDTLHFVRYAPLVAARGGRVVLEVQPELRRLIAGMEGVAQVLSPGDPLPDFCWQCPLMSLPLAFRTGLASIPASVPYLNANDAERERWSQRLQGTELRVGVAWAGNPGHSRDSMRSIRLAELAPLTAVEGTQFYSLQKGAAAAQIRDLPPGMTVVDLDPELKDFADTAAIVANLDLVISVDTSVVHLAGALGKPVWVLLHQAPDWRWLLDRQDSPWYPTMRLFRKSAAEDWQAVVHRLRDEVDKLVRQKLSQDQPPTLSGRHDA